MKTKYWVAFSYLVNLESEFVQKLYEHFGDIERAFFASEAELREIEGLNPKKLKYFLENRNNINIENVYEEVLKRDIKVITFDSENYPKLLREIYNPPMILYYKGDLSICNLDKTLAVVGSRRCSFNGKESLKRVMKDLLNTDLCIVSGLATGIDTLSHQLAIENNLSTIGVIAGGLDFVYPASNRKLYEEIIAKHGVVMSEYYPTVEPIKFLFPQRNRIVTGLSYGTLVVEAAIQSGALISANLTLEQGRELLCIPGLITNPNCEGIYKLLKNGATMVTETEDILNALNWKILNNNSENIEDENLTVDEKKILYTINIEPKGFDEIQKETEFQTDYLLMTLTKLELLGKLEQIVGDRYSVIR